MVNRATQMANELIQIHTQFFTFSNSNTVK